LYSSAYTVIARWSAKPQAEADPLIGAITPTLNVFAGFAVTTPAVIKNNVTPHATAEQMIRTIFFVIFLPSFFAFFATERLRPTDIQHRTTHHLHNTLVSSNIYINVFDIFKNYAKQITFVLSQLWIPAYHMTASVIA
jgi:hypothetical protein